MLQIPNKICFQFSFPIHSALLCFFFLFLSLHTVFYFSFFFQCSGGKSREKTARKLISVKEVNEQNWELFKYTHYNAERERKMIVVSRFVKEFKSFTYICLYNRYKISNKNSRHTLLGCCFNSPFLYFSFFSIASFFICFSCFFIIFFKNIFTKPWLQQKKSKSTR